jgi:hypothetical protein
MKVELSDHAKQQIQKRKLSQKLVVSVAHQPEQIVVETGELSVAQSRITFLDKSALLRVVFRDEDDVRLVITAYPTTRVKKYWQEQNED